MSESKRTGEVVHGPVGNGPQQGMNCISHGQPTPLLSSNQNAAASTSTAGASTPAAAASAPNADNNTQTVAVRGTSSAAAALASTHYEAARATAQQPVRQHATPATPAATPPQPHAAIPASSSLQPQHVAPLHLRYTMPIHILQPPAGPGGYPMIGTRPSETPEVFRHRKLRSGKWTSEEESYADILIELFEKGHIDEKNGCTLRSFLSKKLHCAPMRISKKYAGKGIGKMVYLSKTNITGVDGVGSAVYNANMTRLREAEVNFLKIVYPEMAPPFHHPASPFVPPSFLQQSAQMNGLAPIVPTPPASHMAIVQMQPQQTAAGGVLPNTYQLWAQPNHFAPTAANRAATAPPKITPPASLPQSAPAATTNVATAHQNATNGQKLGNRQAETLHQAYLRATSNANQQQTRDSSSGQGTRADINRTIATQQAQTLQQAYLSAKGADPGPSGQLQTRPPPPRPQPAPLVNVKVEPTAPLTAARRNEEATARTDTRPICSAPPAPRAVPVPNRLNPAPHHTVTNSAIAKAGMPSIPNDIPDFLSGFDKVTGKNSTSAPPYDPAVQCSPTYTSQSFDDLHRFLGKDLSPVKRSENNHPAANHGIPVLPLPAAATASAAATAAAISATDAVTVASGPVTALDSMRNASASRSPPQTAVAMKPAKTTFQAPPAAAAAAAPIPTAVSGSVPTNTAATTTQVVGNPASLPGRILQIPNTADNESTKLLQRTYVESLSPQFSTAVAAAVTAAATSDFINPHLGADSYNIFAQQSAFAASQHSAYIGNNRRMPLELAESNSNNRSNITNNNHHHSHHRQQYQHQSNPPQHAQIPTSSLRAMHNPNVVSETSTGSDQGSDDSPGESSGSGTECIGSNTGSDNASNDSDGTSSDSSSRKTKQSSYSSRSAKRARRSRDSPSYGNVSNAS